jgi:signal transduction histidine kinase
MRSLTFKLVLAFLLTSVTGVALASVFIRQSVTSEFDEYVLAQQRATFVDEIGAYYARAGSWVGVDQWLRDQFLRRATDAPADSRRNAVRLRFVLADTAGTVVIPFGRYTTGTTLTPADMARGAPVLAAGRVVGTVITPDRSDFRNAAEDRYLARTDAALGIAAAVMVAVAAVLGVLLARLITRPVRELTAAAQHIAAGDLTQQVPVRSRDELGVLTAQFNRMSADLARATELRRQMTADVAHDLRTPLTVIAGYLEALRDQVLRPTPERFATMYDETRLLLHLVDDLHTLSLADAGELPLERYPADPAQLLAGVAGLYRQAAEAQGVTLQVQAAPTPPVCVDAGQITRALNNLVSNALRHTPPGGLVCLAASIAVDTVLLTVTDTGEGIAPEHIPAIFERFYRADPSRQQNTGGSGLGLAIVRSIVEAHHGSVSVVSTLGEGTTFTIALPATNSKG